MATLLEQFLAPVDRFAFTAAQFPQMEAICREQSEAAVYLKIKSYADISLSGKGLIAQRYKFTKPALRKYCQELCRKLYPLVLSLLEEEQEHGTLNTVVDVINRIAVANGKKLLNWSFIVDSKKSTVVGLISPRYYSVSNVSLLRHIEEYMAKDVVLAFHDGLLHHRRLAVRFLTKKPVFTIPAGGSTAEPYYAGFYFANSETGDCAIHACPTILRGLTKGAATSLAKEDSGWLPHVRTKGFVRRLFELLDATRVRPEKMRQVREQLLKMKVTKLGFTPANYDKLFERFLSRLQSSGLTAGMARSLMTRAIVDGSYAFEKMRPQESLKTVAAKRNFYDLFTSLLLEARRLPPLERETVEGLAYRVLNGKFLFNQGVSHG